MVRPDLTILRALGLGDLLTAVPALRALARAFPRHRRVLAAPAELAPLLSLIECEQGLCVDELIDLRGLDDDPGKLPRAPEAAVNLHGRGPESHRLLVASAPQCLIAFANPEVPESGDMPAWDEDEHEVDRWCRMLRESGIETDPDELWITRPGLAVPPRARGATLIHPGAASAARRWPADRWATVARAEVEEGHEVLLTGSGEERDLCESVAHAAGLSSDSVLAGRTDLPELAALVASAGVLACGDTGVAHLASALGTASVILFGPTSPRRWGPPPHTIHRPIWAGHEGDPHADTPDQGLLEIDPRTVIGELATLHAGAVA
ncbi:MAG: glycosyltransferase family 9 protein [Actinobacteria bacterium]|nr:glycosyltransferase family 9 protein [Actinomycetota bacterium]